MSDISIPGVSNKYQTQEMIKAIMDAERIPLNRLEDRKETYVQEKAVWQQVNRTIDRVRESARKLYGFQNPFQNLIATSSQETSLTATASRAASEEKASIEVVQEARADRFASRSLPGNYKIPEGTYRFRVGDEEVSVPFRGGDLNAFSNAVNRRGTGVLASSVVRDTFDTKVLVLGSLKTGAENRLFFDDAAKEMAIEIGILEERIESSFSVQPEKPVEPGSETRIPIQQPFRGARQMTLRYSVENLSRDSYTPPNPPPGPELTAPEGISFEGLSIRSSPSEVDIPEWTPPPPPPYSESTSIFSIDGTPLPDISGQNEQKTITLSAGELPQNLEALTVDNRGNTHRRITIHDISITDPSDRGDATPASPVSTASDAIIKINGIEVRRPDNEIEDVISGVTLNVRGPSDGPVDILIEPDREAIKDDIIAFVGSYNQLMTRVNIVTDGNESVVNEIEYFTDDEREEALEQLGIFRGDTTFMQLKNRLREIVMTPYETSAAERLSMLSQIGISSNSSGIGGGVDARRMRGYLEINESQLDEALNSDRLPAIKELFGTDSDQDLVVDTGVGYDIDQYTTYYVQTGGLIATRISGINQRIERTDNDIERMELSLEDKEQQLRIKYGQMESALGTMEENSRALENLNRSGQ
jgi:flagellar hook-associated protein 2